MYCLTREKSWELRIDYRLTNRTKSYLHYKQFAVGPAEDQYQLSISGFDSVGLPDPFSTYGSMDGMKFSSRDHDNDLWSSNCAQHRGGWWHRSCGDIMLNNNYNTIHLNDRWHVLPFVEIKIRPFNCDK